MRLLIVTLIAVAAVLAGCRGAPAPPVPPETQSEIVVGQGTYIARETVPPGRPVVPRDRAIEVATAYASRAGRGAPADVSARYVALSILDAHGKSAFGVENRGVWEVVFRGLTYVPPGEAEAACPCIRYFERPTTVVALDARSGDLVLIYGQDR